MKAFKVMKIFSFLTVIFFSTDLALAQEIRDIKPPVDLPGSPFLLVLSLLVGGGCFIFFVKSYLDRRGKVREFISPKSSWDNAYDRLNDLKSKSLPERGEWKPYYSEISQIIRLYMEERFMIKAPEMTTQEFMQYLQTSDVLTPEQNGYLQEFLNSCDMVKFAKYQTTPSEAQETLNLAKKLVDETKALTVTSHGI